MRNHPSTDDNADMAVAAPRAMLRWYDAHARSLPWRVRPKERKAGRRPDPYAVWLSEIMLQQTTVATVAPRFAAFLAKWPTVDALASASVDEVTAGWAGLGYYARARNLHKCADMVARDFGGAFPATEAELLKLPGIGPYTAAAISAIAFDRRAVVVDGNVERVAARLFAIETPMPQAKPELKEAIASIWPKTRSGDFAQGLMDLGATICTPTNPSCLVCPVRKFCKAAAMSAPERFPVKAAKTTKPQKFGIVYALFDSRGFVLVERRPAKGLLGGMLGLPTTAWADKRPADHPPVAADWRTVGEISHIFTHFRLSLDVKTAEAPPTDAVSGASPNALPNASPDAGSSAWINPEEAPLPTLMRKALNAAIQRRR